MLVTTPDILMADQREVSEYLLARGLTRVETWRTNDGLAILANEGDAAIADALAGWVPESGTNPAWKALPVGIKDHVGHMRDYRDAVRAGQTPTAAQTAHALADVIDFIRLTIKPDITG